MELIFEFELPVVWNEMFDAVGQTLDRLWVRDSQAEVSVGVVETLNELRLSVLDAVAQVAAHFHLGFV